MGRKKKTEAKPLAHLEREARAMLAKTIESLSFQLDQYDTILRGATTKGHIDGKMIRDISVTQGIAIDKTRDVVRALRDLEASTDEEIEAVFDIYEEDETGKRTLVSKAKG